MDTMTKEQRSRTMSRIRSKGTRPEVRVADIVKSLCGYDMTMNDRGLPGSPDIVIPWLRKAVFVDGCFWHAHAKCYRPPKTNKKFWAHKVSCNRARDARVRRRLRYLGWSVITVWECSLRDETRLRVRLAKELGL